MWVRPWHTPVKHLSGAPLLGRLLYEAEKACQRQTLELIRKSVNYGRNKFYDTGPWTEKMQENVLGVTKKKSFVTLSPEKGFYFVL